MKKSLSTLVAIIAMSTLVSSCSGMKHGGCGCGKKPAMEHDAGGTCSASKKADHACTGADCKVCHGGM